MRLLTLDQFYGSNMRNAYVREPGFESLYVRHGQKYINGQVYKDVIDIANVTAKKPGKGAFTKLVERLRKDYPKTVIYVECVLNPRFGQKLKSLGFTQITNHYGELFSNSYYLLPKD